MFVTLWMVDVFVMHLQVFQMLTMLCIDVHTV